MKNTVIIRLLIPMVLLCPVVAAELPTPAQRIVSAMASDLAQLHSKAIRDLERMQARVLREGDLDQANAIKTAIDRLTAERDIWSPPAPARTQVDRQRLAQVEENMIGAWITPSGSAFSLRRGGRYTSGVVGWSPSGRWEVVDETTLRLVKPRGAEVLFDIEGGAVIFNREDRVRWRKQL